VTDEICVDKAAVDDFSGINRQNEI
jgi:hypothetical protein